MLDITIDPILINHFPNLKLGCLYCSTTILERDAQIDAMAQHVIEQKREEVALEKVSGIQKIQETKEAYRKLGKDPSRYRPSAEALTRRIVQGKDLYQINNVVDLLNIISISSGFSIGGYDADAIQGTIQFGIGLEDEPYEAIGRGSLNIKDLPIFRDSLGPFGSPTSDSTRTMVNPNTTHFLMIIIDFHSTESLVSVLEDASKKYEKFAHAKEIAITVISKN